MMMFTPSWPEFFYSLAVQENLEISEIKDEAMKVCLESLPDVFILEQRVLFSDGFAWRVHLVVSSPNPRNSVSDGSCKYRHSKFLCSTVVSCFPYSSARY